MGKPIIGKIQKTKILALRMSRGKTKKTQNEQFIKICYLESLTVKFMLLVEQKIGLKVNQLKCKLWNYQHETLVVSKYCDVEL